MSRPSRCRNLGGPLRRVFARDLGRRLGTTADIAKPLGQLSRKQDGEESGKRELDAVPHTSHGALQPFIVTEASWVAQILARLRLRSSSM
jgi:hypothetical protein